MHKKKTSTCDFLTIRCLMMIIKITALLLFYFEDFERKCTCECACEIYLFECDKFTPQLTFRLLSRQELQFVNGQKSQEYL